MKLLREAIDRSWGGLETVVVRLLRLENRFPPLFIVGAPRSGTTVVYQHVVHRFRTAYFPNLSRRFPRACVSAAGVVRLSGESPPTHESRFGEVEGAGAPSDGWEVFHRWFPRYDYSVPIREARLHELRTIVRLLERVYEAPFVNKNNSNSVRIRTLRRLFPDALLMHVRRDLAATVDSILRGRRANRIPRDEWWGAPPPQFLDSTFDDELERVVAQVWGVRQRIRSDLEEIPEGQRTTVSYEGFCADPAGTTAWVREAYERHGVSLVEKNRGLPSGFRVREGERARDPAFRRRVEVIVERLEAGVRGGPSGG